MARFVFLTIDGVATGAVYAAFALSLVLIWRAARIVNFAQGAISVAAAYLAWTVGSRVGGWWVARPAALALLAGVLAALLVGALLGLVAARRRGPYLAGVTLAWGTLFVVAVPIVTSDVVSAVDANPMIAARLAGNLPLALLGLGLIVVTLAAPGGIHALLTRAWTSVRSRTGWPVPRGQAREAESAAGTGAVVAIRDVRE